MTIISQEDKRAFPRSLPGGFVQEARFDPAWITVGLVSLCGLAVSVLVLASGAVDLAPIFLG
jgi:hypothetical protein